MLPKQAQPRGGDSAYDEYEINNKTLKRSSDCNSHQNNRRFQRAPRRNILHSQHWQSHYSQQVPSSATFQQQDHARHIGPSLTSQFNDKQVSPSWPNYYVYSPA